MFRLPNKTSLLLVFAFTSIYIFWGLTFLAVSYGLLGFPPFILCGLRFVLAGMLLFSWRYLKGERQFSFGNWKRNAITGILILCGGTGLVAWAEQYVSAAEAAIAIATGPFWFIVIDRQNWRRYFSSKAIVTGLLTGFAGLLLFLRGSMHPTAESGQSLFRIAAFALLAVSPICWVLGSLYSRKHPASHSTFMNIAQQLIVAGLSGLLIATIRGEWTQWPAATIPAAAWAGLVFLVLFGSLITYMAYIWLLSVKDPVSVSTHTYINPVVAVLAGWMLTGERLQLAQGLGLLIILGGVLLTNSAKYSVSKRSKVRLRRFGQLLLRFIPMFHPPKPQY